MMKKNSLPSAWLDLLSSESKRWGIQFLIMLGAIPSTVGIAFVLTLPWRIGKTFNTGAVDIGWFGYVITYFAFISYYLFSLKLHHIFDRKKTFNSSFLLSIRPYITIPLVIQALAAWGGALGIPRDVGDFILEFFEPINAASFPLLFISSILLTWMISEWVCRFQRWRGRVNEVALANDVG